MPNSGHRFGGLFRDIHSYSKKMIMVKRDYYDVLGLSRDSSEREISKSYRRMAVKFHPDSNPGDEEAHSRFKEAAEAYEVLSDSDKRARYDRFGHAGVDGAGFSSAEDIFSAFGEIFGGSGGLFGDFFGRSSRTRRGADIRVDVELTLEEASTGVKRPLTINRSSSCATCDGNGSEPGTRPQRCQQCGGRGQIIQSTGILSVQTTCPVCRGGGQIIVSPCHDCNGRGAVDRSVNLDVAIPAGVDDGMRVRLTGEGEPGPTNGPAGDCYCFINIRPHKLFHRDGQNLILQMPITYTQAALGSEIVVPTLRDRETLKIPRGTQSGAVFKIAGEGMPHPQGGRTGDLLVQTFIETPKKLSSEQEELLRKLAELEHSQVLPERKNFMERIKEYFATAEN